VVYEGEKTEDTYSVVKTKIISPSKGTEIPVDYRLENNGGNWMVYDVVIEGVSLVYNYREQFNDSLQGSSYDELVKKIQDKIAEDNKK
jgi:phospholipid transport system substrate-binding protein